MWATKELVAMRFVGMFVCSARVTGCFRVTPWNVVQRERRSKEQVLVR